MKVMREFVKYDDKVYRFALALQKRQYESFRRRSPSQLIDNVKTDAQLPSEVEQDEDGKTGHSPVELDEHSIVETRPTLDDYKGEIEPMWSCKDTGRKKKLVFVHLFKTAGSTMRQLLRTYSETCNAGLNIVVRCAPVLPESIRTGKWMRADKVQCNLIQTIYRNNISIKKTGPMNTTHLEESDADILAGHITMGTECDWKDESGKHVDVQYLAFFRESTHKYVSAVLFMNPTFSFHQAVARIRDQVPKHVKNGEYLDNSGYLITPAQIDEYRNSTLLMEDNIRLMMKNLKENNVLVGIVERMSESLEMIQDIVDKDGELDSMFESFGKKPAGANATKEMKANKSKLSSEDVLAELEKDEEFMKVLREFVKYDDIVYRFALDMHMRQYESFRHRNTITR